MTNNYLTKISVIMGIYNCAATLSDSIDSIIHQTVSDWELIMCDDGSTDETFTVAQRYRDLYPDKFVLLKNNCNQGLNYTLNRCLEVSRGKYIARMDGDDLCSPNRFYKELAVLENEMNISIVSTDMAFFDETGIWGEISHPEYPSKQDFIHGSPFCHASCMVRREAFDTVKGYSEEDRLLRVEDYHLWFKMYRAGYKGKNIHEVLYQMRDDRNAYGRRKFKYRLNEAYVRWLVIQNFKLPFWNLVFVVRPVIVGLMPNFAYDFFHKRQLESK